MLAAPRAHKETNYDAIQKYPLNGARALVLAEINEDCIQKCQSMALLQARFVAPQIWNLWEKNDDASQKYQFNDARTTVLLPGASQRSTSGRI